jgi:hypothetical protein
MMKKNLRPLVTVLGYGLIVLALSGCGKSSVGARPRGQLAGENSADRAALKQTDGEKNALAANEEFMFPPDKEGKLLAEVLRPSEKPLGPLAPEALKPRRFSASPSVEKPQLPLLPSTVEMPRQADTQKGTQVRPGLLPEEPPLAHYQIAVAQPEPIKLPAGPRVRLPSTNVNQPIPLPILAQPISDRVPLDDPTVTVSHSAALAETFPGRTNPAPFLRLTLPDPFEHRNVIRLLKPLEEEGIPFSVLPGPSKL